MRPKDLEEIEKTFVLKRKVCQSPSSTVVNKGQLSLRDLGRPALLQSSTTPLMYALLNVAAITPIQ
jgi:hypothetical protein